MESPVRRPRGRPRKRRREDENTENEAKRQKPPVALVGRFVLKDFPGNGIFLGKVVNYESGLYRVAYEDGDYEDLDSTEVRPILVTDTEFNRDLVRRRNQLEKLAAQYRKKVGNGVDNNATQENKEELPTSANESNEVSVNAGNEECVIHGEDTMDDCSSDSDSGDREFEVETEAVVPLPPRPELPPSSGTIGVPEQSVQHLFSVYGYLRSFSISLFLQPFTLDEFVGALNCRTSNTLFDAVHVSLMRILRHLLEADSLEGSKLALKCLRCNDWSLLDSITWPVFLIQYLVVSGYKDGPEWKEFYDEVCNGEYYLFPVSRKLMILQILCDKVLESEEMFAEMNMRTEVEVGLEYYGEDILSSEDALRRVHSRQVSTSACNDYEAAKPVSASNYISQHGSSSYSRVTQSTKEGDEDRNGDDCRLCGMDGILLCCDGCPSAYHSRCIGVLKNHIPEGPWYCPECKINMTGPAIAKGTSLRGAEIFGRDLYGQLFMGTCEHLLVLDTGSDEFCLRYYNQNDIPKVLQVLNESMQHRPIYHDICMAVLRYWSVPESFLLHSVSSGTNVNLANIKEETTSSSLLPPLDEGNHKAVSLVKEEYPLTTTSTVLSDNMEPSLDASSVTPLNPAPQCNGNGSSNECPTVIVKLPEDTRMESIISVDSGSVSVSHQSDMNCQNFVDKPTVADPAKCSLVNGQFSNYDHVNDTGLPANLSLQTKESTQAGFGKWECNLANDFVYKGSSYKPLSYINYYIHGDFAASAAAKFALLSSEESRSEGHVSDNQRKTLAVNINLQAKSFSQIASRFFWPSSEKKLVEVPRERCGWCFSCKAPNSSKRGCLLNHAALSATKSAVKMLAGFPPIRSGEGILPSIATYIIYMEECLRGLVVGPFLSTGYRRQWRKQVEQATTFRAIKSHLLKLEENIRTIAFCGDWLKLMDDWFDEFSMVQSVTSTPGTAQKRAPSGRRYKKRSATDEATTDGSPENFVWWRGGKFNKYIFQKAVLPKSMVRKAARQGGSRKFLGIFYADGFEIPKRSRQLVWRAAVQRSRNASQLALQVRYLDFYLRWSELIRPEQSIQEGKGQENEASAFRNANICDHKLVEGRSCYGIAFGSQKHLPSRVVKNVVEKEQGPEGKEKYWFYETRIPLYLVKEYEEGNGNVPCNEEHLNTASELQLHKKRLKAICKDIFFYLTCKRDNLDVVSCSVCQMGVLIGNAHKCNACQGYCHEDCSTSSIVSANEIEFPITCKQCYNARLLAQKETSDESPTSPLLLKGQENNTGSFVKGSRPKSHDQGTKSSRKKASNPDMKRVTSVTAVKGTKAKFYGQEPTSTRTTDNHFDMQQVSTDAASAGKRPRKNCSWGIIWKKKNNEDNTDFMLRNILLKGGSNIPHEPVCHLCRKPYMSDLIYICCETCRNWYHADAVELEESKISDVSGFKCCKCRRIKSPVCPYSDSKPKRQEGKRSRTKITKKDYSGPDSDSGAISDMREGEPATPVFPLEEVPTTVYPVEDDPTRVFPVEDDPLLFSLPSVELVTQPKIQGDVEWNNVSGSGQKLPVRRHVKHEGDDVSFGGIPFHDEFSNYSETGTSSNPAVASSHFEYGSAVDFDNGMLNDSDNVNYDYMEYEPNTYFSLTELLNPDDASEFDVSGDFSGYLDNSNTLIPGEGGDVGLADNAEPSFSWEDTGYYCLRCSQMDPPPDLCCENCGYLIHSHCSPWVELPSSIGSWRCGNCRE